MEAPGGPPSMLTWRSALPPLLGLAPGETGYVALLTGDHDIIVDAVCKGVPHVDRLLRDEIQTIDGVERVTTYSSRDVQYSSSVNFASLLGDDAPDGWA